MVGAEERRLIDACRGVLVFQAFQLRAYAFLLPAVTDGRFGAYTLRGRGD
jgi:hypothetical protein